MEYSGRCDGGAVNLNILAAQESSRCSQTSFFHVASVTRLYISWLLTHNSIAEEYHRHLWSLKVKWGQKRMERIDSAGFKRLGMLPESFVTRFMDV